MLELDVSQCHLIEMKPPGIELASKLALLCSRWSRMLAPRGDLIAAQANCPTMHRPGTQTGVSAPQFDDGNVQYK